MSEKTVYIRETMTPWKEVLLGASSAPPWMGDGFLPVFDTLEQFKEAYPDEEPVEATIVNGDAKA